MTNLRRFDGVIDQRGYTYDNAKSDLYLRASRALEAGDARTAEGLYREVIKKYPDDINGYEALGACFYFQGKYAEAQAEYSRANTMNPRSVDALYGLGCVAYAQARNQEAKDYLEKALALDQKNALCHRVLGCVYEDMGDVSQAGRITSLLSSWTRQ